MLTEILDQKYKIALVKMLPEQEEYYVEVLATQIMDDAYENSPRYHKSHLTSREQTYRCSATQRCAAMEACGMF